MAAKFAVMMCASTIVGTWFSGCMPSGSIPPAAAMTHTAHVASQPYDTVPDHGPQRIPEDRNPAFHPASQRSAVQHPWPARAPFRKWKYIVLHHTATTVGNVESIHTAHLQRKDSAGKPWQGIGYHFVIGNGQGMPDGRIEPTFRWRTQLHGAHAGNRDYNSLGIGVVLVGNFEEHPPTAAQNSAVQRLVDDLRGQHSIDPENIVDHRDLKNTSCPGRYFAAYRLSEYAPETLLSNTTDGWNTRVSTVGFHETDHE